LADRTDLQVLHPFVVDEEDLRLEVWLGGVLLAEEALVAALRVDLSVVSVVLLWGAGDATSPMTYTQTTMDRKEQLKAVLQR
jgi:hypothetical protein